MSENSVAQKPKVNNDTYSNYIRMVKRELYGDNVLLKPETVDTIDDMISMTFYNLKRRIMELTNFKQAGTICDAVVKHAALLEFPQILVDDAMSFALIAQTRRDRHDGKEFSSEFKKSMNKRFRELKNIYNDVYFLNKTWVNKRIESAKNANNPTIRSEVKGGMIFPIGRIQRHLKTNISQKVSPRAAFCVAAILELVTIEILNRSVNLLNNKSTLTPRHIMLAIRGNVNKKDEELKNILLPMFHNIIIENSGEPRQMWSELKEAPKPRKKVAPAQAQAAQPPPKKVYVHAKPPKVRASMKEKDSARLRY